MIRDFELENDFLTGIFYNVNFFINIKLNVDFWNMGEIKPNLWSAKTFIKCI